MPATNAAPVDLEHLARYTGGARDLNVDVLRLFADQSEQLLKELDAVIAAGDEARWRHITHSLKGAAQGIGAFALADAAIVAEPLDLAFEAQRASAALATLRDRTETVHAFIQAYLQF
jgi:HPt (histidine-containing phosphotransfer) domain-containing protein